jgi:hypothetical protein
VARLTAQIQLSHQRAPKAVAAKVVELSDGGLAPFEIAPHVGLPPALVTLILRAAAPSSSSAKPWP